MSRLRIGVIGHVEHITLGRVPVVPGAGAIAHLEQPVWFPGGGGGVAFHQLVKSAAEVHLFTAIGDDEAGAQVERQLEATRARVHVVRRRQPHTRDVVMIDPSGERTIVVVGEPLHPRAEDPLPWSLLPSFDAIYFTATDPEILRRARAARRVVASARRKHAIDEAAVRLDAVVGSVSDPRERGRRADYVVAPGAVVMTDGAAGGMVETEAGEIAFTGTPAPSTAGGAYGAGDSFAGAYTYYLARGSTATEAAGRAAPAGAAALAALNTLIAQIELI